MRIFSGSSPPLVFTKPESTVVVWVVGKDVAFARMYDPSARFEYRIRIDQRPLSGLAFAWADAAEAQRLVSVPFEVAAGGGEAGGGAGAAAADAAGGAKMDLAKYAFTPAFDLATAGFTLAIPDSGGAGVEADLVDVAIILEKTSAISLRRVQALRECTLRCETVASH